MAVPDTDNKNTPSAGPTRPSWETARPAPAAQRPAPAPARTFVPASMPSVEPAAEQEPPAYQAPAYQAPAYQAPAYQAPAYQAPANLPPMDMESDVKYDLAGNPIPGSGSSSAPPAAFGYAAGSPAGSISGGTWPPPIVSAGYGAHAYTNNSGEQGHLPPEIERLRWHWGAFFFPTFWSRRHGLRALAFIIVIAFFLLRVLRSTFSTSSAVAFVTLYVLYAVAHLGIQIYFGMNGHKIGWRNRHFPGGVDEYFKVQNRWMWWGFGINALGLILLAAVLIQVLLIGHQPAPYAYGHGGASTYGSGSSYGNSGQ